MMIVACLVGVHVLKLFFSSNFYRRVFFFVVVTVTPWELLF